MFPVYIYVDYIGAAALICPTISRSGSARILGRFRANANRKAVLHWHTRFLPIHFSVANRKYSFQRRRRIYNEIKRELGLTGVARVNGKLIRDDVRKGGQVDLVRRQRTEGQARARNVVHATPNRAKLTMIVPTHVARRPRDGKPNMAYELVMVTRDERDSMKDVWQKSLHDDLVNHAGKIRQRIP